MKKYFDEHYDGHKYDATARRRAKQTDFGLKRQKVGKFLS